ncbi:ATP synthase F1 subunit gamma [Candidatus Saccharibacteria bacterium]|nr:MAG: ATP synthase F1 subunit gamma [Candidatus Saccharibacteria bacterium]
MASTRQLKSRIRSVKNTRQITKAMELVAASKMRRAQEASQATSLYSQAARELLTRLAELADTKAHVLFRERPIQNRLLIVITSDKGLAGAYNSNILKTYAQQLKTDADNGVSSRTITIGRKGAQFVSRIKDAETVGAYQDFPERPTGNELRPILTTIVDQFISGEIDAVDVVYTHYINSITQIATVQRVLPAGFKETEVSAEVQNAEFEPSVTEVLEKTAVRLIEAQLFQALLDSVASEHSMRMVAMKNATDNASDLIGDLTLEMNKVRQAAITQELAEISGGVEAMK